MQQAIKDVLSIAAALVVIIGGILAGMTWIMDAKLEPVRAAVAANKDAISAVSTQISEVEDHLGRVEDRIDSVESRLGRMETAFAIHNGTYPGLPPSNVKIVEEE